MAAAIDARLAGLRVLELRAAVDIAPLDQPSGMRRVAEPRAIPRSRPPLLRPVVQPGTGLAEAGDLLEAGAAELDAARELMP